MPGMLTQAQNPPAPSPGPGPQTPPIESPGAGAPTPVPGTPPLDGASGPGQPMQAPRDPKDLKDQATKLIYGERFDSLVKMFETNGPEKFARSMAIAVNTAINEIEKDGPIPPEAAAQLGMDVFTMLLEDMATEPEKGMPPVVPEVSPEQLQEVLPAILVMYGDAHPNVSKEDIQAVMRDVTGQVQSGMGMDGGAPASAGPSNGAVTPSPGQAPSVDQAPATPPPGMLSQSGGPV